MSEPSRFAELLSRARSGDKGALQELADEYEPQVRLVARARLGTALRPYLDSVDLVQSVHRSLMLGLRNNHFEISSPDRLIALAVTIVRRKVARQWRRMRRQQRWEAAAAPDLAQLVVSLSISDPSQIASLREQTEQLFSHLDDTNRQLIELRLEGYSTAEAARRLGCDPEMLRVRLFRLRRQLKDLGLITDWM